MIKPISEYSTPEHSRSITDLKVGELITVTLTQLDSVLGEFLGIRRRFGIRWFGIRAYGAHYVGGCWFKMSELRSVNFVPPDVAELYYKFDEVNREQWLKDNQSKIAPFENESSIILPDTVNGVGRIAHGVGGLI